MSGFIANELSGFFFCAEGGKVVEGKGVARSLETLCHPPRGRLADVSSGQFHF